MNSFLERKEIQEIVISSLFYWSMFSDLHCQISTRMKSHAPVRALYDIFTDEQGDRSRIDLKNYLKRPF